jgi:hypothetical protein
MTEHVEEGTLQAWLDDELQGATASDVARHLEQCAACRDVAQGLRTLESGTTAHLLPLEGEVDLDAARWKVRQRRAARRDADRNAEREAGREAGRGGGREGPARTGRPGPGPLQNRPGSSQNRPGPSRKGKGWSRRRSVAAAAMLVLVAGGAAALPGSPIRAWIGEAMGGAPEPEIRTATVDGESMAGVAVGLRDGRVEIVLRAPRPSAEVEIRVGGEDRVELQAPVGARYSTAPGRVEADLADAGDGPLLILIPSSAREVHLAVERRPIMTWSGGTFRLEEGIPAETRGEAMVIRLPTPDPPVP